MARPRKMTMTQVQQAAADKRKGMTWKHLSIKYECSINTLRNSLLASVKGCADSPSPSV